MSQPEPLTEQQLDEIDIRAEGIASQLSGWLDRFAPLAGEERIDRARNVLTEDVPALTADLRRARDRVADLEGPAVEARAALAALCYDLEDPGSNALGALYLISRVTVGVEAPRDEAPQVLASHEAQVMRRCAEFVRDTYDGQWADDAAATLERDADITEHGCPGYEDAGRGDSVAERQLANCKHCGRPRAVCLAASEATIAPLAASHGPAGAREGETAAEGAAGRVGDSGAGSAGGGR